GLGESRRLRRAEEVGARQDGQAAGGDRDLRQRAAAAVRGPDPGRQPGRAVHLRRADLTARRGAAPGNTWVGCAPRGLYQGDGPRVPDGAITMTTAKSDLLL